MSVTHFLQPIFPLLQYHFLQLRIMNAFKVVLHQSSKIKFINDILEHAAFSNKFTELKISENCTFGTGHYAEQRHKNQTKSYTFNICISLIYSGDIP